MHPFESWSPKDILRGSALAMLVLLAADSAHAQNVLRVKPFSDLRSIDPITTTDYAVRNHGYMVYDTLFSVDEKLRVRPQMVDRWDTSADGLTWTFRLRSGLAFHDEAPVTAADVVASLKRWAARDNHGQLLTERMASLDALDDNTFRIVLKKPWGLLLEALGKPSSLVPFIMPARIAATPPTTPITDPVGSGPYIMRRDLWVSGSKVVYDKNTKYVPRSEPADGLTGGKRVAFDRVEWVIMSDPQTATAALQRGEIDIYEDVSPDLVPVLARRNDVRLETGNSGQHMVLRINSTQPPFNNPKLRQALRYAVDQANYIRAYTDDAKQGKVCASMYTCSSPYMSSAGWVKPDLERARALVREAGYDGTPVVILQPTDIPNLNTYAQVTDQLLRDIGLKTRVEAMDWASVTSRRAKTDPVDKGGWSIFVAGPNLLDTMDPLPHFAMRAACEKSWPGWPCDAEMENLRGAFADAVSDAERKKIAEQYQLRALEVVPYQPLGELVAYRGFRANLSGALITPVPVYWNISRKP